MGYPFQKKEIVAILLAGGQGSRLGPLTKRLAKPAVPFGGRYRIIDFALSNCTNSGIDVVGVLTQYQPLVLSAHIGVGSPWGLDTKGKKVAVLPPYTGIESGGWYRGTANAVFHNTEFIEQWDPDYVLIISGDHVYKMDYSLMLQFHKRMGAEATVAVTEVPWEEAHRFGLMHTADGGRIVNFEEKPKHPKSNLASMGVYIFNWPTLKEYLIRDAQDPESQNDFGRNIIPSLLKDGKPLFAYRFRGYWKDVGTIESLWEANMELLDDNPPLDLFDRNFRIYSVTPPYPPEYVGKKAKVVQSMVGQGCQIYGEVEHCVLFHGVFVGEGASVRDSVIMPHTYISSGCKVRQAILGTNVRLAPGTVIGVSGSQISVVAESTSVSEKSDPLQYLVS